MVSPIALLLAVATLQGPPGGFSTVVRGQVRNLDSAAPLRFAVIEVVGGGPTLVAPTDSSGTYVLRNVPPGVRLLRATHIDHAAHEVEVFIGDGKEILLDFDLELRPVKLPAVTTNSTASRSQIDTLAAPSAALVPANVRALESTPGVAELGLADLAREVPGQEPVDPSDILYVRGGAADLKLVLLDGAPVYAPFHLGGLINPLDQELLHRATLYLGGAPARYDGGLSYVMDLETRAGRGHTQHAEMAADMLSARATLEGPVSQRVTYLLGGRTVHGIGARPFMPASDFPYVYADGLGRLDIDLGRAGRMTATGFWNRESVRLDSLSGAQSRAVWGNAAGSFRYRGTFAGSNADLTVGVGAFRTQLPVGGVRPLMTDGLARRLRIGLNLDRPIGALHVHYGLQFDRLRYDYSAWPRPRLQMLGDSLVLRAEGAGEVAGTYFDIAWQPAKRLQLRGGLRADVFSLDPTARVAPRAAATMMLSDRASLTIAAGKYRQYVRASATGNGVAVAVAEADSVRPPSLRIASASHVVLSLDQDLGTGIRLGIEGFYKNFDGLSRQNTKHAQASGLDLWVRRPAGRLTGWLGYSLAWIWATGDNLLAGSQTFAGRHLVSAGAGGPLGEQGRFDVRVAYGAGLPYTAIPEPDAPPVFTRAAVPPEPRDDDVPLVPRAPDEPYLRVDVQVARTFNTEVRGFAFELTPYFKLLNALDRRDALFYHFDRRDDAPEARPLAPLPVLPILGFEWKF